MSLGECFILETIMTNTHTYKFGTTDVEFTLLLIEDKDAGGNIKSEKYVVMSLRDEDCFAKSSNVFSVTHIFSKPNDSKLYDSIIYFDNKKRYELTEDIYKKLDDNLRDFSQK